MKIFERFYSYLTPKNIKYFSLASIFISFLFLSDSAFADTEAPKTETDPAVAFFSGLIKIVSVLLSIATVLVSALMSPEWTTGSVLGLDKPLKELWYLISNVVYFLFSLIFIYIAIMNIVGKGGDYELKSALPRFIVGLLIVPFSWFIVQFVISISGVLTVAVLSIPYDTFKNTDIISKDLSTQMVPSCKNIIIGNNNTKSELNTSNINDYIQCEKDEVSLSEVLNPKNSSNIFGIINIYTYGVMKIDKNAEIFSEDLLGDVKDAAGIVLKLGFDGVFVVIYCFLVLALMMALFVRGFWMWMFAMFSPLFGLLHFFKKGGSGAGGGDMKNFNFVQLIKLALMPVYVAGALSFGLLFLFVAGKGISGDPNSNLAITNSGSTIKNGDVTLTFLGPVTNETASFIAGFQGTIGTIFLQFLGIAILWVAVIAALKSSEITQTVVSPFENMGNSIGKLIKNAPSYTPIIPTSEGFQSVKGIEKLTSTIENIPNALNNNRVAPLQNKIQQILNVETVSIDDRNKFKEILVNGLDKSGEYEELMKIYLQSVEKFGHQNKDVMDMREQLAQLVKTGSGSYMNEIMYNSGINNNDRSKVTSNLNDDTLNKFIVGNSTNRIGLEKIKGSTSPSMISANEILTNNKGVGNQQTQTTQQPSGVNIGGVTINNREGLLSYKEGIIEKWDGLSKAEKERLLELFNNGITKDSDKATIDDLPKKLRDIK